MPAEGHAHAITVVQCFAHVGAAVFIDVAQLPEFGDVGVPDEKYGEELLAAVQLRDGAALEADDVKAFCRGKIAHYKIPRYVTFVDDYPMTVTGKIQKFKLREQAIEDLGLHGAAATRTA